MKAKIKKRKAFQRGKCRYCGCTHFKPCWPACCWLDLAGTVCSADICLQKAVKDGVKLIPGASLLAL